MAGSTSFDLHREESGKPLASSVSHRASVASDDRFRIAKLHSNLMGVQVQHLQQQQQHVGRFIGGTKTAIKSAGAGRTESSALPAAGSRKTSVFSIDNLLAPGRGQQQQQQQQQQQKVQSDPAADAGSLSPPMQNGQMQLMRNDHPAKFISALPGSIPALALTDPSYSYNYLGTHLFLIHFRSINST